MTPSPRDHVQGVCVESENGRGGHGFKDHLITYFTCERLDLEFPYMYYMLWSSNKNSEKRKYERIFTYEEFIAITGTHLI